jgi:hypothetical protein
MDKVIPTLSNGQIRILVQNHINNKEKKKSLSELDAFNILVDIQNVLVKMSLINIKSVALIDTKDKPTSYAVLFENLIKQVKEGFLFDKMPCFWSCREGKKLAYKQNDNYTDSDYPIIRLLFEYCIMIRDSIIGYHNPFTTEMSYAISRIFAWSTRDVKSLQKTVPIFMGSDKITEATGFHMGNNFWIAELPILWVLLNDGSIDNVILHILDYNGNHIRLLNLKHHTIDLPIWRRNWHIHDNISTKKSFVDGLIKQEEWDKWRTEPPRQYITYSRLKEIIKIWKRISTINRGKT